MKRRPLLGILVALFLVTSSLGLVISFGWQGYKNFNYVGTCLGEVNRVIGERWVVYSLQDLNIPGAREGGLVFTYPSGEVQRLVHEKNLLYWKDALVEVNVRGKKFLIRAYVLGNRGEGDAVALDCSLTVRGGRPVTYNAIEIPGEE